MIENGNDTRVQGVSSSVAGETVDQLRVHAHDITDKLTQIGGQASSATSDLKEKASDMLDSAKSAASQAAGKVAGALEDQKSASADKVKSVSDAIRRAAAELEQELPFAATQIKKAADEIEDVADAVKQRDLREIVVTVQDFARRQPAAFLGATVLGGFALVRLLKTPIVSSTPEKSVELQPTSAAFKPAPSTAASAGAASGDPGGIAPQAPGFETSPSSAQG